MGWCPAHMPATPITLMRLWTVHPFDLAEMVGARDFLPLCDRLSGEVMRVGGVT